MLISQTWNLAGIRSFMRNFYFSKKIEVKSHILLMSAIFRQKSAFFNKNQCLHGISDKKRTNRHEKVVDPSNESYILVLLEKHVYDASIMYGVRFADVSTFSSHFIMTKIWGNDVMCRKMTSSYRIFTKISGYVPFINIKLWYKYEVICII